MVTDEMCNEKHRRIDEKLDEMHTDIKLIRDNHLVHVNDKIDKMWIILVILSVMSGGQLALKLLGV